MMIKKIATHLSMANNFIIRNTRFQLYMEVKVFNLTFHFIYPPRKPFSSISPSKSLKGLLDFYHQHYINHSSIINPFP